jgi:hypothetical protein
MFFEFHQNNTGGSFTGPAHYVIVEADSAHEANEIAEDLGLYWNGCDEGYDCPCCGDRWYPLWDDEEGSDEPEVYGETDLQAVAADDMFADRNECVVLVRYKNGQTEEYK